MALAYVSFAAPEGSVGEIAGHVIDGLTGKGIARARVVVTASGEDRMILLTDDEGAFRVRNLPATRINIWAQRNGYLGYPDGSSAQESVTQVVMSATADAPTALTLKLTPQCVIEGKAATEKGASVALVRLWTRKVDGTAVVHGEMKVDRKGEFRFASLAAGRYYLDVSSLPALSSPITNPVYLRRFYKEETTLQTATAIDVQAGQTKSVSILLQSSQGRRIRGRIASAPPNAFISLHFPDNATQLAISSWDNKTGTFAFSDIPPGNYVLDANWNADGRSFRASMPLTVSDTDLDGILLAPSVP